MLLEWDSAITSIIYHSIASSEVFKSYFVHSRGHLSPNLPANIPELRTSWCSISQTVQTHALVEHGGFLLCATMNWSRSSQHTPAVRYIPSWRSSTSICIDSHPIACGFLLLLLPDLHTIPMCASRVTFSVATIAAARWTNWCLRCCSVSPGGPMVEAPVIRLDLAPITPGWSSSGAMACCCGMVRKMITKWRGKSWRLYG